jgi:hypothetical protein
VLSGIQAALDNAVALHPPPPTPPRHSASLRGGRGQPAAPAQTTTSSEIAALGKLRP